MRNAELGINSIRISSAFRIPNSPFRIPETGGLGHERHH